jgi:hypothetical protein
VSKRRLTGLQRQRRREDLLMASALARQSAANMLDALGQHADRWQNLWTHGKALLSAAPWRPVAGAAGLVWGWRRLRRLMGAPGKRAGRRAEQAGLGFGGSMDSSNSGLPWAGLWLAARWSRQAWRWWRRAQVLARVLQRR